MVLGGRGGARYSLEMHLPSFRFRTQTAGPRTLSRIAVLALCLALLCACGRDRVRQPPSDDAPEPGETSPRPRPELLESLSEDLRTERHPTDGGGRAWIDPDRSSPPPVVAGSRAHFTVVYEAGPLGVPAGGMVILQPSSFWGWSSPHQLDPGLPGYTEVDSEAAGIELEIESLGSHLFGARIAGRALAPGERLRFHYGSPEVGVRVDDYAEREAPLWIAVDGDGDGVRGLVLDSPRIEIVAGPPAQLLVTAPSVARPGESFDVVIALVDRIGNSAANATGRLELESDPAGVVVTSAGNRIEANRQARLRATAAESGIYRLKARFTPDDSELALEGSSAPLFVTAELPRVLWGDLHGHSSLSDGTGTPEDYFSYARDVAGLEVVALTDHDHWGMRPLARTPELWQRIRDAVEAFHRPGEFVTLLGYEWTNWLQGHRHVLYFDAQGEVLSSVDPAYDHPTELWSALEGQPALTFTHHSAGEPVPTNWNVPPHPELEPVAEIVSVHGSSEAADSPGIVRGAVPGNFVRDALDRGYRLGFIGSGDSHDGHPGLAGLASPSAGLAAILSEELSREGVYEALRARRVYATNGPRILLHTRLDDRPMGSLLTAPRAEEAEHYLVVLVLAPAPIDRVELIRSGAIDTTLEVGDGRIFVRHEWRTTPLQPGHYLYVRALLEDGGAAWSSPYFAVSED